MSTNKQPTLFVSSVRLLALLGLVLCVAGFLAAAGSRPQAPQTAKDADTCGACHEDVAKAFGADAPLGHRQCVLHVLPRRLRQPTSRKAAAPESWPSRRPIRRPGRTSSA